MNVGAFKNIPRISIEDMIKSIIEAGYEAKKKPMVGEWPILPYSYGFIEYYMGIWDLMENSKVCDSPAMF